MSATGDEGSSSSEAPDVRSPARSGEEFASLRRAGEAPLPPPGPAEDDAGTVLPGGLDGGGSVGARVVSSPAPVAPFAAGSALGCDDPAGGRAVDVAGGIVAMSSAMITVGVVVTAGAVMLSGPSPGSGEVGSRASSTGGMV